MKWKKALVGPETSIQHVLEKINAASTQLALVVDAAGRLLGTLSDGDVRRALLSGKTLADPVNSCMCLAPVTAKSGESRESMLVRMRQFAIHQLPVLDDDGHVIGLKRIDDLLNPDPRSNWVVIMAGGLGTRLKELTLDTPKPMLAVGDKPLLETIIGRFVEQGFPNIWLAVNYHAEQIERYFKGGDAFGANIRYLRENTRLGTAGALSLLPTPDQPILISNADLLAKVDYAQLLEGHLTAHAMATMAVRKHEYRIPYGVIHTKDGRIEGLEEKPVLCVTINAGIYVLSPPGLANIPHNTFFDMPELFSSLITAGHRVCYQHVEDYWLDIGRYEDLQQALIDFPGNF